MASVGEVKSTIDAASAVAQEIQAHVLALKEKAEELRGHANHVFEQSGHDCANVAIACLQGFDTNMDEASQMVAGFMENIGQYSAGL